MEGEGRLRKDTSLGDTARDETQRSSASRKLAVEGQQGEHVRLIVDDAAADSSYTKSRTVGHGAQYSAPSSYYDRGDARTLGYKIPDADDAFCKLTFLVLGTAGMLAWNLCLTFLPAIRKILYPKLDGLTDGVTAMYFTGAILTALPLSLTGRATPKYLQLGLIASVALCVALGYTVTSAAPSVVSPALQLIGLLLGLCTATLCCAGVGVAAESAPAVFVGYHAAGMGSAGLFSFFGWQLVAHRIYSFYDPVQVRKAIWTLSFFGALVNAIGSVMLLIVCARYPVFKRSKGKSSRRQTSVEAAIADFDGDYNVVNFDHRRKIHKSRGYGKDIDGPPEKLAFFSSLWNSNKTILKHIWTIPLLRIIVFCQTCCVFPNIGPTGWVGDSAYIMDCGVAVYQVADFLGRYSPNWFPQLVVGRMKLLCLLIARAGLIPLFIMGYIQPHNPIWGNTTLHLGLLLVLALTNGWFSSVATLLVPKHLPSANYQSQGSAIGMASGFVGIFLGQWSSKLLKMLFTSGT